ncbi:hypothetical protein PTTG_25669 [Puccinia triticina 1-1 BBBD Race 1]|uniref:Uncharacterized protein n=2 Tax=Puccinia triticina TaxID=208348 RepID=A0A180H107_PUCT1|nr:uncharacterized protein PtA15_9A495 [Puccinia triticina]OAV98464.1 hypothetical protein PTTG_25669 [Puccinia triticina 1-1 BBBD Race 1]WAQ88368.1 hypothetical protein PtA15_9A495 [Puccinia triticina]
MADNVATKSPLATLFHFLGLGLLLNAFRLTYRPDYFILALFAKMGGRANFLTMWGLFFSTVTFVFNTLITLFPRNSSLRDFRKLSLAIALPIESVVTTLYWPIVLYNPKMMMNPELEAVFPLTVDLALHLYPAILLWIDYFAFSDRFASSSNGKIKLSNSIQLSTLELNTIITVAYVSRIELLSSLKSEVPRYQST